MRPIRHRRFFVPPEAIRGAEVEFGPAQAHQLAHVLRLGEGDRVSVLDGTGREWTATLTVATARRATALLLAEQPPVPLPRPRISLAQVAPRGAAMDLIVAKATELGVARIRPVEAAHSVRRASERGPRWQRILIEAAEQCGRRDLPVLEDSATLEELLQGHPPDRPLLACHDGEGVPSLLVVCEGLRGAADLTLLVGGEGGLAPAEVARVRSAGGRLVWLGPRLLRADTAALAALAILQACLGDWTARGERV
jgi:16S rRNA (uracil1498-N3)-methyltransferase